MARLTSLTAILATVFNSQQTPMVSGVEIDEATNQNSQQSCQEEIQRTYPWLCRLYMIRSPLRMVYDRTCCTEVKRLDDRCQCEALVQLIQEVKVMAEDEKQVGFQKGQDMQDVLRGAEKVPVYCKFQSVSL